MAFNGLSLLSNIPALMVGVELQQNQFNLAQTIESLSTGLQINLAGNNPGGNALANVLATELSISQAGSQNAQNGISITQTASGGAQQIATILQQLGTLATQAAGPAETAAQRQGIQTQVNTLMDQINQIVGQTQFGGRTLLDGSLQGVQSSVASALTVTTNAFVGAVSNSLVQSVGTAIPSLLSPQTNASCFLDEAFQFTLTPSTVSASSFIVNVYASSTTTAAPVATLIVDFSNSTGGLVPITVASSAVGGATFVATLNFTGLTVADIAGLAADTAFVSSNAFQPAIRTNKSMLIQVGSNIGQVQPVVAPNLTTGALFSGQNLNVTTLLGAQGAEVSIQHAVNIVSSAEASLGTQQSAFTSTTTANTVLQQNLSAAYNGIVNINVAQETTKLLQQQVLVQTDAALLAQANLLPLQFLTLLPTMGSQSSSQTQGGL